MALTSCVLAFHFVMKRLFMQCTLSLWIIIVLVLSGVCSWLIHLISILWIILQCCYTFMGFDLIVHGFFSTLITAGQCQLWVVSLSIYILRNVWPRATPCLCLYVQSTPCHLRILFMIPLNEHRCAMLMTLLQEALCTIFMSVFPFSVIIAQLLVASLNHLRGLLLSASIVYRTKA